MRPAIARLRIALLGIATAVSTTPARAEGGYVIPGLLASPVWGHARATGWGGEVSWMHYASSSSTWGFGAFAQAQAYSGDDPTHGRFAIGAQTGYIAGIELGAALRTGTAAHPWTTGVHVGPYLSLGIFTLGARFVIPFAHGEGDSYGFEGALVIGLKGPIPYGKPPPDSLFGSGRPMVVGGGGRVAALVRTALLRWGHPTPRWC